MTYHLPVMRQETAEYLIHDENGIYVDCTLGGGGHSEYILEKYENTKVIGIDQDNDALKYAAERLSRFGARISLVKGNFKDIRSLVTQEVSGFLLDLGISSWQVDEPGRGFSFRSQNLDMRMDAENPVSAENLVNELPEDELARIFFEYGEERKSRQIARAIVEERAKSRITSSVQFAELIGRAKRFRGRIHPATQVFQALRIAVNNELENLKAGLDAMPGMLLPRGRVVVMSYHSLEDRIVKQAFKHMAAQNILNIITKKVVKAPREEQKSNPRSRSAKLRCAEKI
jgi:16S rRNA (cytosine1402-N4)-methyltransferase